MQPTSPLAARLASTATTSARPTVVAAKPANLTVEQAGELKKAYTQFVGESLFGSLLKSMRKTVGEPAYFHGGMAEEQFQSQLDQHLVADLAGGSGDTFADGMFRHEFPEAHALLTEAPASQSDTEPAAEPSPKAESLDVLSTLRRR